MGEAAVRWREELAAWAIPDHITAAVADSPWAVPTDVFARRADSSVARPGGASYARAREALGEDGTVLDVGSGAGAASLPLGRPIIAVDPSAEMLAALTERAQRLGLPVTAVRGRWPDVADRTGSAAVAVCHHVAYNVPDLGDFVTALSAHAHRRVVLELTPAHPMLPLNPLWSMLHGLDRPLGPTVLEALDVIRDVGLAPKMETTPRPPRSEHRSFDDLVAITRQRLCLTETREPELRQALIAIGVDPLHPRDLSAGENEELVTLWWDV